MNVLHQAMGSGAWSNAFHEDGRSVAVEWSNAFRALLGFENEEDFPNSERVFFERVHPDDWERMMQLSTNVVNGNIFLEGKYLKLPKMTAIRIKLYRPISEKFLGIDFAMHGMCAFSIGERAGYPMFYRNTEKKLAQEQRKLSRCQNWM